MQCRYYDVDLRLVNLKSSSMSQTTPHSCSHQRSNTIHPYALVIEVHLSSSWSLVLLIWFPFKIRTLTTRSLNGPQSLQHLLQGSLWLSLHTFNLVLFYGTFCFMYRPYSTIGYSSSSKIMTSYGNRHDMQDRKNKILLKNIGWTHTVSILQTQSGNPKPQDWGRTCKSPWRYTFWE